MAKVSRKMLKSIVKECLVEILAEGLTGGNSHELNESISSVKSSRSLDNNISSNKKVVNEKFEDNTRKIISHATKDPVMAELLADTAQTTLQEQNGADRPNQFTAKPTDTYSQIANESDPMDLFGGSSNNWAALAFSDSNK
jgi:hypothetical protein